QDRVRLGRPVRAPHREEPVVAGRLVGDSRHEGSAGRAALRPNDQIDVGNFVAVADQGLTHHEDVSHRILQLSSEVGCVGLRLWVGDSLTPAPPSCGAKAKDPSRASPARSNREYYQLILLFSPAYRDRTYARIFHTSSSG